MLKNVTSFTLGNAVICLTNFSRFSGVTESFKYIDISILSVICLIVLVKVALAITENRTIVKVISITAIAAILSQALRTKFVQPVLIIRHSVIDQRLNFSELFTSDTPHLHGR